MRLGGRRKSDNVDDRRGKGGSKAAFGLGGAIVIGIIVWILGGNPLDYISEGMNNMTSSGSTYTPTAEDEEAAEFAKTILAGTEDIWTNIFKQNGLEYTPPKMVLFSGSTHSSCGAASASTGPFYCPTDQTLYIDLSFFQEMKNRLNAGGEFAYAYVIAHEVGHHVQNLLGTLDKVQKQQQQLSQTESNKLNIRLELQADFYAGVWAHHENKVFNSIEDGDIDAVLNAASQIWDDRIQMNSQGYTTPDSFNHGTSEQRSRWLKKGLETGNPADGDTFSIPFSDL